MYDFAKREIYMLLIIGLTTDMIRRFDDFLIMTMYPTYNCGCFQYTHNACFSLACANGILQNPIKLSILHNTMSWPWFALT